jgi:hypothetical protein
VNRSPFARSALGVFCLAAVGCSDLEPPTVRYNAVEVHAYSTPPVSGGTLLALRAGGRAVVSDFDGGAIRVVNLGNKRLERTIWVENGADPGRIAEDLAGRVHVVLRGAGEVLTFDPNSDAPATRRRVCKAPRGIAVDPVSGGLVVACLEGVLAEMSANAEAPERVTFVDTDLRDVLFAGTELVVTRFRSAEVLYLDAARTITWRRALSPQRAGVAPTVAWRAVATPSGSIVVVHQRSNTLVIDPAPTGPGAAGAAGSAGAASTGGASGTASTDAPAVPAYYGDGSFCGGIVTAGISILDPAGNLTTSPDLGGAALPVDVAIAPNGNVAIANGAANGLRPYVVEYPLSAAMKSTLPCVTPTRSGRHSGKLGDFAPAASAVAYEPLTGALLVHRRGLPALEVYGAGEREEISLDLAKGARKLVRSLGHDYFHFDSGFGVACASCHPEGTDDGHVWQFTKGPRKTQPLDVRLSGTEPFHWNGEFANFGALLHDIFEQRMGANPLSRENARALEQFIYDLNPRPAMRDASDAAALRGHGMFESRCAGCHEGPNLSINDSTDVGRGGPMQVPSLLGVGVRAPYMHDGCAKALFDRFEPTCGGAQHGNVSDLDEVGRSDLAAYLETL